MRDLGFSYAAAAGGFTTVGGLIGEGPIDEPDHRDEGFAELAEWFETLAKAERSHANRFQKGLDSLKS